MRHPVIGLGAVALILSAVASPSAAQTASQLSVKDATGATRSLCETADGSGNLTPCLQSDAPTATAQTAGNASLAAIAISTAAGATATAQATANATLTTVAANTKPVTSFGAVTVGTAFTPGLGIAAICTTAGNVVLSGSDGSSITVPVGVGFNQFGFAVASVAYPGSGAASCSFTALR